MNNIEKEFGELINGINIHIKQGKPNEIIKIIQSIKREAIRETLMALRLCGYDIGYTPNEIEEILKKYEEVKDGGKKIDEHGKNTKVAKRT